MVTDSNMKDIDLGRISDDSIYISESLTAKNRAQSFNMYINLSTIWTDYEV